MLEQLTFFILTERLKDDIFEDEISANEISKRALESAKITFNRLKSTFVGLTKQTPSRKRPGKPGPSAGKKTTKIICLRLK